MAEQQRGEGDEQTTQPNARFGQILVNRYQKMKEHAETYPYVWASYSLVYGGFALWIAYRWRKLRQTEDRVRALQKRLRELVEEEERACSVQPAEKSLPSKEKSSN